ncbi:hypothetical protein Hte_006431 [Hypoxylon texense]
MAEPLPYSVYQYGTHELQRVGVWDLGISPDAVEWDQYWVIYIHGGAWRDPRVTHKTVEPSIERIRQDASGMKHIAAFASIDYRLSPHPDFPQDPATTPPEQYRGARHPDHVDDVRAAIRYLQGKFGFGERYILVGHSAGATLSYQIAMTAYQDQDDGDGNSNSNGNSNNDIELPVALCGLEGIYDFHGLNDRKNGTYAEFLTAAFGDPAGWDAAAPMKCVLHEGVYGRGELWVLAHSPDDELVDMPESEGMAKRLLEGKPPGDEEDKVLLIKDLRGKHDDVWRDGEGVASAVRRTLDALHHEAVSR